MGEVWLDKFHNRQAVSRYMKANAKGVAPFMSSDIDVTALAEEACLHFNGYVGDDVPEDYFELAVEVAEALE